MRVKTGNGVTEVYFRDFEAVEPKVVEIRRAYREKTIDESEVERQINGLFGPASGSGSGSLRSGMRTSRASQ